MKEIWEMEAHKKQSYFFRIVCQACEGQNFAFLVCVSLKSRVLLSDLAKFFRELRKKPNIKIFTIFLESRAIINE